MTSLPPTSTEKWFTFGESVPLDANSTSKFTFTVYGIVAGRHSRDEGNQGQVEKNGYFRSDQHISNLRELDGGVSPKLEGST